MKKQTINIDKEVSRMVKRLAVESKKERRSVCKSLDYAIGDLFIVVDATGLCPFSIGSVVSLTHDDGGIMPLFTVESGGCIYNKGAGAKPGGYCPLWAVRRVGP